MILLEQRVNNKKETQTKAILWNQWLAGLIDGDGCFLVSKAGQLSLEITVAREDEPMLQDIQKRLGGGRIKPRAGSRSVRLRIMRRGLLLDVVNRVNGSIRLASRLKQLDQICHRLKVTRLSPLPLTTPNGYISGLFDADGSITLSVQKTKPDLSILPGVYGKYQRLAAARGYHQLSVHIVAKDLAFLEQVHAYLGGALCIERANTSNKRANNLYRWYIRGFEDVMRWSNGLRKAPLRSQKQRRCFLLSHYFALKQQKAHLAQKDTIKNKDWVHFCRRWFSIPGNN